MQNDRTLYLDNEPRLGEWLDDGVFQCNFQWWRECGVLHPNIDDNSVITEEDAVGLADMIVLCWCPGGLKSPIGAWGKDGTAATRAFIRFLRGGSFCVVNLGNFELQN